MISSGLKRAVCEDFEIENMTASDECKQRKKKPIELKMKFATLMDLPSQVLFHLVANPVEEKTLGRQTEAETLNNRCTSYRIIMATCARP